MVLSSQCRAHDSPTVPGAMCGAGRGLPRVASVCHCWLMLLLSMIVAFTACVGISEILRGLFRLAPPPFSPDVHAGGVTSDGDLAVGHSLSLLWLPPLGSRACVWGRAPSSADCVEGVSSWVHRFPSGKRDRLGASPPDTWSRHALHCPGRGWGAWGVGRLSVVTPLGRHPVQC